MTLLLDYLDSAEFLLVKIKFEVND